MLRRPRLADVPDLFAFLGDPAAMRFTQVDASLSACRRRIAAHEFQRRRDGFAPWTVVLRRDGRTVGWGGIYKDPFDPGWGVEVGYFFHPDVWGQGLAGEFLAACTALADGPLALARLRAFAHPGNLASRRALGRAGFAVIRHVPQMDRLLFERPAA